jgi:cardiolipin synthase (CMP-forming)
MNIPNFISLSRILLVPVIVIFLMQGALLKALAVLVVSAITDALDGFLARILKQQTVLGAYLDPIADKALLISCYITLSIKGIIPGWLTVIVISRDCIILIGIAVFSIMSMSIKIRPAFISKVTTAFQLITLIFVLIFRINPYIFDFRWVMLLYWATAFFTIISGLNYMFKQLKLNNARI